MHSTNQKNLQCLFKILIYTDDSGITCQFNLIKKIKNSTDITPKIKLVKEKLIILTTTPTIPTLETLAISLKIIIMLLPCPFLLRTSTSSDF